MDYKTFNQFTFGFFMILALILFYQSWTNLVKKELTKFSLDAWVLFYVRIRRGEKYIRKSKKLLNDEPQRLRSFGIIALISGVVALYQAIDWYIKYLH